MPPKPLIGVRILAVCDTEATGTALRAAVEPAGPEVRIDASSVDTALAQAGEPHLCLLVARGAVCEEVAALVAALPRAPVIVLTPEPDEDEFLRLIAAGASGYLPISVSSYQLIAALCDVLAGLPAVPRRFTARLVRELEL